MSMDIAVFLGILGFILLTIFLFHVVNPKTIEGRQAFMSIVLGAMCLLVGWVFWILLRDLGSYSLWLTVVLLALYLVVGGDGAAYTWQAVLSSKPLKWLVIFGHLELLLLILAGLARYFSMYA